MVNLVPLRGVRYREPYARASVYAPPYDVISPAERERLIAQDEHNVVRLTLGPEPMDPAWYQQSAALFRNWLAEGILGEDPTPCLYGYEQRFRAPGQGDEDVSVQVRHGLVGRVPLAPWGEGIYRHEHTRAGPKADRLRLMRAVRAQMSPVFGLYSDPSGETRARLADTSGDVQTLRDPYGVEHRFWPICQPGAIHAIQSALAGRDIVIADGHHRYETALAYREERRQQEGDPAERRPYDHVLMYLADAHDPGLTLLATHRVIDCWQSIDREGLLRGLEKDFDVTPVAGETPLAQAIAPVSGELTLGAYLGPVGSWTLRLKDREWARRTERTHAAMGSAQRVALADLDVVVFQDLILGPRLDITPDMLTHSDCVSYTTDEAEARARVDAGEAQAAFILNPTTIDQIWRAACAGLTMPQKSTYFYPKLLTGLVIHRLD
jgi:uncharacterized protein (DUF1015 family)